MKRILVLFLVLVTTIFAEVKTELTSYKVLVDKDGVKSKVEATEATPGDIIGYNFFISNGTEEALERISPTIPVPAGTTFIPDEGDPKNYLVSINERDFSPYPIMQDGVPVDDSQYRLVSWNIEKLEPGESLNLEIQVKVNGGVN
ncbi:hypothetical protein [Cetobacterium sp. ZWU0022]|uniref:hypothetical protein n=1 Tax=Cetobacterium sp. ZWU0022 TaxID=1340502 RepID=UPI0006469E96|nr:hypothetical protein [Cetobacterium sp. ZWU0022]